MFGFKKRKQEAAKREAIAIGQRHIEIVNATLEHWRANALDTRRALLDEFFAERLVAIEADSEMSYEMVAEIEALALTKNWVDRADDYALEFWTMLNDETIGVIESLNLRDEVSEHVYRQIGEVSGILEDDLNHAIEEAVTRRGELPTPRA